MGRKRSKLNIILNILIWGILFFIAFMFYRGISFKPTDITSYADQDKDTILSTLDITVTPAPYMKDKIYEYTDKELSVDKDDKTGFAVIYLDDEYAGIHIDSKKYSIFGLQVGDAEISVENKITYEYDRSFQVIDEIERGVSDTWFFENYDNNTGLALTVNNATNCIVAITYYTDMDEITKELSSI